MGGHLQLFFWTWARALALSGVRWLHAQSSYSLQFLHGETNLIFIFPMSGLGDIRTLRAISTNTLRVLVGHSATCFSSLPRPPPVRHT